MKYLFLLLLIAAAVIWVRPVRTLATTTAKHFSLREKFQTIQNSVQARLTEFFRNQLHTAVDEALN